MIWESKFIIYLFFVLISFFFVSTRDSIEKMKFKESMRLRKEAKEKKATIALRNKKEKAIVDLNELKKKIKELGQEANTIIQQQAEKYFADNTKTAKTFEELKKIIETHRGFVKIPFCNTNNEGKLCAGVIKSELNGVDICGTPLENPEQPNKDDKCIVCNKEATSIVYAAKSV